MPTFISSSYLHEECPDDYDEYTSKRIYEYWINKRQINKAMPLIKHIEYVLEQRENAELLIMQINTCLKTRQKMLQVNFISRNSFLMNKIVIYFNQC